MGLFDKIFGGGTRDEKSVQSDINKALKDSGGRWTENLNDLVAERDRTRSRATTSSSGRNALSQGLGSFGRAVSSIPRNIARDVKMGTSAGLFSGRDKQAENLKSKGFSQADIKDYFARTDATIARNAAQQDFGRSDRSNDAPFRAPIGGDGSPLLKTLQSVAERVRVHLSLQKFRLKCAVRRCVSLNRNVVLGRFRIKCSPISRAWVVCLVRDLCRNQFFIGVCSNTQCLSSR
jgi:hypothetical protein